MANAKGAGRPAGKAAIKTAEARERLFGMGTTPLDVMAARMRKNPITVALDGEQKQIMVDDEMFAAAVALAPYVHPRLSQVEAKVESNVTQFVIAGVPETASEDEWVSQHQNVH